MEGIQGILEDWAACKPEDVVLRSCNIGQVISRVAARADALADADAKGRVYDFLAARGDGPPLLVQRLCIDGGYKFDGTDEPVAVVHFLCFWRTLQEVCIASRSTNDLEPPREAVAKELGRFRNGLLDGHNAGTLTVGSLIEALVETRRESVDQSAWAPLQATVAKTATVARERNGLTRDVHDEHLPLDAVSMLVLPWLKDLTKDYLRGEKARRIKVVSKSLGCEASAACSHLCAHRWNVEITLRRQRAANALATQRSQVQKLTQDALAEVAHATYTATAKVEDETRKSNATNSGTRSETRKEAGGYAVGSTTIVSLDEPRIASNVESTITISEEPTTPSIDDREQALEDGPEVFGDSPPTLQPLAPPLPQPVGNSIFRSTPIVTPMGDISTATPIGDSDTEDPMQRRLSTGSQESQDPLELLKMLSANAEDVEEDIEDADQDEEECQICVQPYGKKKGNEKLLTKCCDQPICAHCAATLATTDGQLRCPFCRRIDRHPAVTSSGPQTSSFDVFQGANIFARDVGRFVSGLFGTPSEQGGPSRPNLRLDVVYR